ncbi:response regulator transcription factor [Propionibacterium ruminifibrarum]|uniref:response regulator transcription factor n=1 Tax=Propionibacterium ruminifibrarum TaxID=1962131 RepID=UPI001603E726|nr:response regulator transcription factor [Propionibacterium ruminifibrarum]
MDSEPVVLIVEDDKQAGRLLGDIFAEQGWRVVAARTGPDGIRMAHAEHPDLVLLDLMLPFKSGDEVLAAIRAESQVPVIVVSARETTRTKIDLLHMGADDYVTKPFDVDEVVARAEAALRRAGSAGTVGVVHEAAGLLLDETERRATAGGHELALTSTEFGLLTALIRAPRLVLSKPQLYAEVWGAEAGYDERTVNTHMSNLRRKIREASGDDPIRTVWGIGYTLRPA